ncbi:uncharacterized protein OsI_031781 isoform X7 [Oryza glaberrima]|uniref:uncharacterized protein OsI_031781 isoform X5 n=1 Tax=Oryza glaberrima TaxID=4538 RepID=UPI00224C5DF6|nr:uncharacterized protein OsI_031781 isoform X5 [Oryza glaberrima]XP_052168081.1 uncharacterized protein OsI_031781 isoform X6 [Oryza glaberrima]XP_052168083.1 uncharacterized protein OsI_031781 isoform X7 [Oryza glaberrima]
MAKAVALLLAAIAASAVLVQVECDAPVEKSFNKALLAPVDKRLDEAAQAINEAADSVVAAAPPAKKDEVEAATWKRRMFAFAALGMAQGDEKKVAATSLAYKKAAKAVLDAAPADMFKLMDESFKVAAMEVIAS